MAVYKKTSKAYSIGKPLTTVSQQPVTSGRAPKVTDRSETGTLWVDSSTTLPGSFINSGTIANNTQWMPVYRTVTKASVASPTVTVDMNAARGCITLTGFTTAAGTSFDFTIVNTLILKGDPLTVSVCTNSTNNSGIIVSKIETSHNVIILTLWNSDLTDDIDEDIIITFDLLK